MRKNYAGSRFGALVHGPADANLATSQWLAAVIVVGMAVAIPARASAQTLNFDPSGSAGVFENGGQLNVSLSTINGNVDIGKNSPTPSFVLSSVNGSVHSNVGSVPISLPGAAHTTNLGNVNVGIFGQTINGLAGVNVFNVGNLSVNYGALTLNGGANDTFIFVVNGNSGSNPALNFNGGSMDLTGGLLASHVIFDVVNGNAKISNFSTADGTFYTQSGSIEVSNLSSVTGALAAGGGGNISVTSLSSVSADPFLVSAAPEMPTIMTAGLAAFLIMGSSGISYLRRKRPFRNTLIAH
jgi:hypothetical protein